MMRILHSADWHLDSAFVGRTPEQAEHLKRELLKIPGKITDICKKEHCQLLLLAGDLFDGAYTADSYQAVCSALEEVKIPVVIAPGNHDFCGPNSPYVAESWPENVHIFTHSSIESLYFPELDCRIYGAGYTAMDCPALLDHFKAEETGRWQIGVLHADPTSASSHYCPISAHQVHVSGLHYLALGHIHKAGKFQSGNTLCAWPGCPMGRGLDETGIKGALIVTLDDEVKAEFLPLDSPRFYDESVETGEDPGASLAAALPAAATEDIYRITLTGYASNLDMEALKNKFSHIPNLELRDRTMPETELWSCMDQDNLEGLYFKLLHDAMEESDSPKVQRALKLAARMSRQILDGQEVTLP